VKSAILVHLKLSMVSQLIQQSNILTLRPHPRHTLYLITVADQKHFVDHVVWLFTLYAVPS